MSRILFALEMGSHFGHVARDLPLALACKQAGHEVLFAVADLGICAKIAGIHLFPFVQAPAPKVRPLRPSSPPPINFARLLWHNGFSNADFLDAAMLGWRSLFDVFQPDLIVHDDDA